MRSPFDSLHNFASQGLSRIGGEGSKFQSLIDRTPAQMAKERGFVPVGAGKMLGGGYRKGGFKQPGSNTVVQPEAFAPGAKYGAKTGGGFLDQLSEAAYQDVIGIEEAQRLTKSRVNPQLEKASKALDTLPGNVLKQEQIAKDLREFEAARRAEFDEYAANAVAGYESQGLGIQEATVAALQSAYRDRQAAYRGGRLPDGTIASPEEIQAADRIDRAELNNAVASRLSEIGQRLNEGLFAGRQNILGAKNQFLSGTSVPLLNVASSVESAARLASVSAEVQGRLALAQFEEQYPYSPVSMFDMLIALGAAGSTNAARSLRPVRFGRA